MIMFLFKKKIPVLAFLFILLITISFGCKEASREIEFEEDEIFETLRHDMVDRQIIARWISDQKTIDAMKTVPRHKFVEERLAEDAYADHPLPIGEGQTISQPYIVALMTANLELTGDEKVLEIGTGSGYQAAVLAEIVDDVYTVEIVTSLHLKSNEVLAAYYPDVKTSNHDGYYGWEEYAPFDRIIVTAAPDHIPPPLIDQLADGGIMVLPVGPPGYSQTLWKVEKVGDEVINTKITDFVAFVPFTREVR